MTKKEFKELLFVLLFSVINIAIAFLITSSLGIQNVTLFTIYSANTQEITYEVLIFMLLSLIEALFYSSKFEKESV